MPAARLRFAAIACVALLLGACHKDKEPVKPGGETPVAAVQQSLELIKQGDFGGFWKHALPPADFATLRSDWARNHGPQHPLNEDDRARVEQTLRQFTAADAETKLYAQLKPKLVQFQQQYSDQVPVMVGIFQAIATTAVDQSKDFTVAQKQQLHDILTVLAPWAQKAPWFDQALAKNAVTIAVQSARDLKLDSAQQWQQLDYDGAMQKYGVLYAGAKQVLALYGLSLDEVFDSAKLSLLSSDQASAQVTLDYRLLGTPLSTQIILIQQDGRWYDRDLLQQVRDAHIDLLQAPAAASSPAHPASAAASAPIPAPATTTPQPPRKPTAAQG
ncbi:MAG: hypothetical protein ABW154_03555 [Dyella sp.]